VVRELAALGCRDLGESRPQDLWDKAAAVSGQLVDWHLVGHLQRNKVRRTLPLAKLIHSVDSLRLLQSIDREGVSTGRVVDCLLEINVSGETTKQGMSALELPMLLAAAREFRGVRIRGLMGMGSLSGGPTVNRREFESLRELRDRHADLCGDNVSLGDLSMGMSKDFEQAIAAGSTMVRIGSIVFDGLT
jgi:pyridoxal phosphate enzyme (YggS family)